MDCPAGFMVASRIPSDISRVNATSCCGTSACTWAPYMILGRGIFWLFSVHLSEMRLAHFFCIFLYLFYSEFRDLSLNRATVNRLDSFYRILRDTYPRSVLIYVFQLCRYTIFFEFKCCIKAYYIIDNII